MKKFLIISITSTLLLTACGGDVESTDQSFTTQRFNTFQISIPSTWRKIVKDDFANTIPEETTALFLNKIPGEDFIQNTSIVKESINTDASSLEYAKANILLGSKALIDYRPLSTEELDVGGIQTVLHSFRARNTTTEPLRTYFQSYFANNRIGYTITCLSDGEDIGQENNCRTITTSFRFL